jgi:alkylation response protein AidB-like acyl-CoA dehydrogenase
VLPFIPTEEIMHDCTPDEAARKIIADTLAILAGANVPFTQPSFMRDLLAGTLRWSYIHPFPRQPAEDRRTGDQWVERLRGVYHRHIHPEAIDATRQFPPDYLRVLKDAGLLTVTLPQADGGAALSHANLSRIYQLSGSWCSPVTLSTAVHASLGVPAFLPYVKDETARAAFAQRIAAGAITGLAATENHGGSNVIYDTTAQPTPDGRHYVLDGRKVYVGNGPLGELFVVPATTWTETPTGRTPQISLFVVDAHAPGFRVDSHLTYMGMNGLPSAELVFEKLSVPAEHMIGAPGDGVRIVMQVVPPGKLFIPAMALGVMKHCLEWARAFSARRYLGLPLRCYQLTQQQIAAMAAAVFALESVLEWVALTLDRGELDVRIELDVIKSFSSNLAWSVLDSTMSLFAGRGYETQLSLQQRGQEDAPVERFFRDLRVLRIFGSTNELVQLNTGATALGPWTSYFPPAATGTLSALLAQLQAAAAPAPVPHAAHLSPANRAHLAYVAASAQRLARASFTVLLQAGGSVQATAGQPVLVTLAAIANELCAMSLTLSRADTLLGPAPTPAAGAPPSGQLPSPSSGATSSLGLADTSSLTLPDPTAGTSSDAPAGSSHGSTPGGASPGSGAGKPPRAAGAKAKPAQTQSTLRAKAGTVAADTRAPATDADADAGAPAGHEEEPARHEGVQELANLFCIHATRRVEAAFTSLNLPDHAKLADEIATQAVDGSLDWLLHGIMHAEDRYGLPAT